MAAPANRTWPANLRSNGEDDLLPLEAENRGSAAGGFAQEELGAGGRNPLENREGMMKRLHAATVPHVPGRVASEYGGYANRPSRKKSRPRRSSRLSRPEEAKIVVAARSSTSPLLPAKRA